MYPWQQHLESLKEKFQPLGLADASALKHARGRRMATAERRLVDGEGRLYSHGTTTCMLFDLPW
jgi:acyl-coenzyme A thioesterase PaaI-like protein